jgi:hypothetical protein
MPNDESLKHTQQFEQAIATTFACRSIIKYNSTLSEEQKNELLADLDTTLQFLRDRLIANASIETNILNTGLPPQQLTDLLAATAEEHDEHEPALPYREQAQTGPDPLLQPLYKLYHAYLNRRGLDVLETRYKTVMYILDTIEEVISQEQHTDAGEDSFEKLLHRARGFISALYYMFHEFAAVLSNILEGKNIDTDTEELSPIREYIPDGAEQPRQYQYFLRDITPLMRVYGSHIQLQQKKGALANSVSDATAFLIFVEERLVQNSSRRNEIIAQLHSAATLLQDISTLLTEYENAMSAILTI